MFGMSEVYVTYVHAWCKCLYGVVCAVSDLFLCFVCHLQCLSLCVMCGAYVCVV